MKGKQHTFHCYNSEMVQSKYAAQGGWWEQFERREHVIIIMGLMDRKQYPVDNNRFLKTPKYLAVQTQVYFLLN